MYLIEPYNAYQKPPRKKHWTEIAEEEALYNKMAQDYFKVQRVIHEQAINQLIAERSAILQTQNLALLSQVPPPPSQQVQNAMGGFPANAGGSQVSVQAYYPSMSVSFSVSPYTADAPVTIQFTNKSGGDLLQYGYFTWNFGDGTTGTGVNPSHLYTNTGSYTVSMTASVPLSPSVTPVTFTGSISASVPTMSVNFYTTLAPQAQTPVCGSHPFTVPFINATLVSSQTPGTMTYFWNFGSGSNPTSSLANPTFTYNDTGSYTVFLNATNSFALAARGTRTSYISASN